jgi:NitT/TauT family transport system permease protein
MRMPLYRLAALAAIVAAWSIASRAAGAAIVPPPWTTVAALAALAHDPAFLPAIGETLGVYAVGFVLAAAIGIAVGAAMGAFRPLGRALDVYANALMATPRVAFVPLVIVLLGLGFQAKIAIVLLGAVMPILINTYAGVGGADPELVEMARATGSGRWRILREVVLPGALPFVLVGLRIGATVGLINTVVAELYTAVHGLGGLLALYGNTFRMAPYLAVVLVLAAIGVAVTQAIAAAERRLLHWRSGAA